MKKLFKTIAMIIACMMVGTSTIACAPPDDPDIILDGRETIYISVFGGGFGSAWATKLCNTYNATDEAKESGFQFAKIQDNMDSNSDITAKITSDVQQADIFFTDECDMTGLSPLNKLLDLSDVWTATPDSKYPTRMVKDKFYFLNELETVWTDQNNKKIALPYTMGTSGIVYDRDLFEDSGWYITDNTTENGLSKGVDGVEGTYDDGLPATETEFKNLLDDIVDAQCIPFVIYGAIDSAGTGHIINASWAQYEGLESYVNGFDYNGRIWRNGSYIDVTPQTGYKVYENAEGRAKGVNMIADYVMAKNIDDTYKYLYADSKNLTHTQSEEALLYSHDNTPIAMTINGAWWENEARPYFDEDVKDTKDESYAYGNRNFGFMPLPVLNGQNPDSNKTIFSVNNFGSVFAVDTGDDDKNQAIIDFLTFYSSDEGLNMFTKEVGVAPGYKFEMEEDILNGLTTFGKIYYEICNSEKVEIVAPSAFLYLSPLNYVSTMSPERAKVNINGTLRVPYVAMKDGLSATEIISTWADEWDATSWTQLVNDVVGRGYVL